MGQNKRKSEVQCFKILVGIVIKTLYLITSFGQLEQFLLVTCRRDVLQDVYWQEDVPHAITQNVSSCSAEETSGLKVR